MDHILGSPIKLLYTNTYGHTKFRQTELKPTKAVKPEAVKPEAVESWRRGGVVARGRGVVAP